MGVTSIERAIRESYLAQGFSEQNVCDMVTLAREIAFADGEPILRQYDETRDLLILVEGKAQVLTIVGDAIGVVRAGMPIGEVSFIDGKPRSVSVISEGATKVACLDYAGMRALLDADIAMERAFLFNISSVLCARLRSANNNIAALLAIDESESKPTFESGIGTDYVM